MTSESLRGSDISMQCGHVMQTCKRPNGMHVRMRTSDTHAGPVSMHRCTHARAYTLQEKHISRSMRVLARVIMTNGTLVTITNTSIRSTITAMQTCERPTACMYPFDTHWHCEHATHILTYYRRSTYTGARGTVLVLLSLTAHWLS